MRVKAAFAVGPNRPLIVDELELDGPRENEVLIEMVSAGLCHTDLMLLDGSRNWSDYPIVLGHEGAGIVRECGSAVTSVRAGDHVIPVAVPECGTCRACRNPRTNLCEEYFKPLLRRPFSHRGKSVASFLNLGTFSQFAVVREIQVTRIRSDVPMDTICCMGCAGATGLGAVLCTARMEGGTSAVVFGLGGVGLNVVEGARIVGATTIIGVDRNPAKERPARMAGITHYLNPSEVGEDLLKVINDITDGGADYSFECVGHPAVLRQAIECTRIGWGTAVSVGVMSAPDVAIRARALLEGRKVMGSFLGNVKTRTELPQFVDWYANGKLRFDNLISDRISLDDINEGFDLLASGEARRVVVDF
jgi:S-(hydroxymethyl)glutathione dehydrogenase / alcohol dehydrogenase